MRAVFDALEGFESDAIGRILDWAAAQFGTSISVSKKSDHDRAGDRTRSTNSHSDQSAPNFQTIADLFATANPSNGPECALVGAYWLQVIGQQAEFDARSLNDELKNLGRPLANVTTTLSGLISQRPGLAIQTQKIGRGAQGRKRYKLTQPGIERVQRMLTGQHNSDNGFE